MGSVLVVRWPDGGGDPYTNLAGSALLAYRVPVQTLDTAVQDQCDATLRRRRHLSVAAAFLTPHNLAPDGRDQPAETLVGIAVGR